MNYNNNISNGRNNSNGSTDSEESASRQNSLPAVHTSIVETTVGESSVLVSQNDVLEQYRGHLPRRKGHRRKAAEGCGGLSSTSWVFLSLALFQCKPTSKWLYAVRVCMAHTVCLLVYKSYLKQPYFVRGLG